MNMISARMPHVVSTKLRSVTALCTLSASLLLPLPGSAQESVAEALRSIQSVSREAQGHAQAQKALKMLAGQNVNAVTDILVAMDKANPLAMNWLRSAVESIVQREQANKTPLPIVALGAYLLDTRHAPEARAFVFDLLSQVEASQAKSLLPGMLNDPSMEIRRAAVQGVIDQAAARAATHPDAAALLYQQALTNARDVDQIDKVVGALKGLGHKTDLFKLFGWIGKWKVIGPFDNTKRAGFDQVYPPETSINLNAEYDGKSGKVRWADLVSTDDYGKVDVNIPLGKLKETIAYTYTEVSVDRAQPAEIRLGCKNAWKIWLNGSLIFGRDEYHRGAEIDQYRLPVDLKAGKNTLLVKLGQNEQKEDWTIEWEFQLRITDAQGTPISPLRAGVPLPITASR